MLSCVNIGHSYLLMHDMIDPGYSIVVIETFGAP